MTGPIYCPPSRASSLKFVDRPASTIPIRRPEGISDRNMSSKRRSMQTPNFNPTVKDIVVRKFNGIARKSKAWDGLRRDPDLWFPDGNCLVHLYGRGQSRRGPAFKIPMDTLLTAGCLPLLELFLVQNLADEAISETSSGEDSGYFGQQESSKYELYIPAPPGAVERGEAFLYHCATRNFFAWMFGKSLVGSHLGGALVGLLNSLNEFRSPGEDNVQAIMDYMDEEAYADLRNSPDHAQAVLFFAEHFQFRDMWMDAFAHCTGMHETLVQSPGFEYMSRTSRALITRSRFEIDMRLEHVGKMLGTFLENELSDAHLGLSAPARAHLDKFRSFLFSYYIAKFGYYPPASSTGTSTAFPKSVYAQMCQEFQKLYDFLVDPEFSSSDASQSSQLGGMCVLQSVQAFDSRHKYSAQLHPLPLLPEGQDSPLTKSSISKRMSWFPKTDKMKPDPRLITFSSLTKATNCTDKSLLACSLVRAYRGFEKDCIFSPTKGDKSDRLSHTDARKVRWILIYGVLQTLLSATRIPKEVRDTQNVSYDLCVLTAGCPPWKESPLDSPLPLSQNEQLKEDVMDAGSNPPSYTGSAASSPSEIKPDIDYFAINHRPREERSQSARPFSMYSVGSFGKSTTRKGTVRRALSTLGNMPELSHPSPKRPIYHEILVHGYGNGTNTVNITTSNSPPVEEKDEENYRCHKKQDSDASAAGIFSGWSKSSFDDLDSPGLSTSSSARTSDSSDSIQEFLDSPISSHDLVNVARSDYSDSVYEGLEPDPLQVKKYNTEGFMRVTTEKKVEYGETIDKDANPELAAYLNA